MRLIRLLNEIDGPQDDADVLFILTTSQPEEIEEALASWRGRIDEATEVANPDAACRARLIALYGRALVFANGAVADFVARSERASAAFVKEMVRCVAQVDVAAGRGSRVERADVALVLREAVESRSRIGRPIVGLANGEPVRAGKQGLPFDACGDDL